MTEIRLNEKQWIEERLESNDLGQNPLETLTILSRYYYSLGLKKAEIHGMLEDFLIRCDPYVNIVKWQEAIEHRARTAGKYPLVEIPYVPVTQHELDTIQQADSIHERRLLFTLLCVAKYGNMAFENNHNWVNMDSRQIFKLANIVVTMKRQALLVNSLWNKGYVGYSNVVSNINICVNIIENGGDPVMKITDFRNLGNQYMMALGGDYIVCQNCGKVIKRKGCRHKYCADCAKYINIQKTKMNKTCS